MGRLLPIEEVSGLSKPLALQSLKATCQVLRTEYLSYSLNKRRMQYYMDEVDHFVELYDASFNNCRATLEVQCDPPALRGYDDILPLLSLAIRGSGLTISFKRLGRRAADSLDSSELQDMRKIFELFRTNDAWRGYVSNSIRSVMLYPPYYKGDRRSYPYFYIEPSPISPRNVKLRMIFHEEDKELWMDGTHSFEELGAFLEKTGLVDLEKVDVQVGVTAVSNKGRGVGLRTKEEQQAIRWLLGRSVKPPKGVARIPKMLRQWE